jgi:hypothetical protein
MESIIETKAITILQFVEELRGDLHAFLAESPICWQKTVHLGVRFVSLSQEGKSGLQDWLSRNLEEMLPEFVAGKFQ